MSAAAAPAHAAHTPSRLRADLGLAIVALIWGTTFVVVKRALDDVSTLCFLSLRFAVGALCLLALYQRRLRALPSGELRTGLTGGAVTGVLLWLGYVLQTLGLRYTTPGKSGFITGFFIVLVPVFGAIVFRRRPQAMEVIGLLVASVGIALLTLPSAHGISRLNRGDVLTIGCAVAFAFHLLVLGRYSRRERFEAVALGQIACAAVLSAASLFFEPPRIVWTGSAIFAIALTGVFATAVAFAVQTWGQQYTTPTHTALIFALEPVFALVTAIVVTGDRPGLAGFLGSALVLAGILAVELKPARAA